MSPPTQRQPFALAVFSVTVPPARCMRLHRQKRGCCSQGRGVTRVKASARLGHIVHSDVQEAA